MTQTGTLTLTQFLLARYDAVEAMAVAARDARTVYELEDTAHAEMIHLAIGEGASEIACGHAMNWDPFRVLADLASKRAIVAGHSRIRGTGFQPDDDRRSYGDMSSVCTTCGTYDEYGTSWPCSTLRLLALPYADHPDFRDEWRV